MAGKRGTASRCPDPSRIWYDAGQSDISGRSGLLAHSFMLGPNGDSNGCVSIKNYERFLKAYTDGEVNRLVVVPSLRSLSTTAMATQRS